MEPPTSMGDTSMAKSIEALPANSSERDDDANLLNMAAAEEDCAEVRAPGSVTRAVSAEAD
jgi:hypothetical protein